MPDKSIQNTLAKDERLYMQKRIDDVFASGHSFVAYPLRIVYCWRIKEESHSKTPVSLLVSVSKKRFKRAVKRNRMKRLIREAFRLNKQSFWEITNLLDQELDIAFLYLKNELTDYEEIEKAMKKAVSTLSLVCSEKKNII